MFYKRNPRSGKIELVDLFRHAVDAPKYYPTEHSIDNPWYLGMSSIIYEPDKKSVYGLYIFEYKGDPRKGRIYELSQDITATKWHTSQGYYLRLPRFEELNVDPEVTRALVGDETGKD